MYPMRCLRVMALRDYSRSVPLEMLHTCLLCHLTMVSIMILMHLRVYRCLIKGWYKCFRQQSADYIPIIPTCSHSLAILMGVVRWSPHYSNSRHGQQVQPSLTQSAQSDKSSRRTCHPDTS